MAQLRSIGAGTGFERAAMGNDFVGYLHRPQGAPTRPSSDGICDSKGGKSHSGVEEGRSNGMANSLHADTVKTSV